MTAMTAARLGETGTAIDGPFTESKDVIGGFDIIKGVEGPGRRSSSRYGVTTASRTDRGVTMRYLLLILEPDVPVREPDAPIVDWVARHTANGTRITGERLAPAAQTRRVQVRAGSTVVTDGPFTEAKEIVGGYALVETDSKEQARKVAHEFMEIHRIHWPEFECECEVRPLDG